ncbi:MAG: hypothetical protein AB1437_09070 [Pseudomonadota bacterium]
MDFSALVACYTAGSQTNVRDPMSNLEKKWWFNALAGGVSAFCARFLLDQAGIPDPAGAAQWTLFFFCVLGFWRGFSFLAWLAVLLVWPRSSLLDSK